MRVVAVSLRDFRGYHDAEASFGDGLTVISGPNGAGKTNLLEALYFGCTGRSCRTNNERELVRFGAETTRVVVSATAEDGPRTRRAMSLTFVTIRSSTDGANGPGKRVIRMAPVPS